jgi:hypothetical protein
VSFANGVRALVEPDVAAWIVLPPAAVKAPAPDLIARAQPTTPEAGTITETVTASSRRPGVRPPVARPSPRIDDDREVSGQGGAALGPSVDVEPLVAPVLDAPASHVRLRVQEACLGEQTSNPDSRVVGAARGCPTVMEVRLAE